MRVVCLSTMGEGMTFTKTPTRAHLSLFLAIEKLTKEPQCVSLRHLRLAESGKEVKMSMNRKKQARRSAGLLYCTIKKCRERDSNPYGRLAQGILSPSCLPVPPSRHYIKKIGKGVLLVKRTIIALRDYPSTRSASAQVAGVPSASANTFPNSSGETCRAFSPRY